MRRLHLLVVVVWAGSGCDGPASMSARPTVTDSAGVTIVSNGPDGSLGALGLVETLRLGVLEGEGPEQFSGVYAVDMNSAGDVFVGDNASGTVRVFDAKGAFVTELGGRGQGPGEVSTVNDVFALGDTVGIVDWQRGGKVVLYHVDGSMLASWSVRQVDGSTVLPLHPVSGGWLMQVDRPDQFPRLAPGEVQTLYAQIHLGEFGSEEVGSRVYSVPTLTLYGTGAAGEMAQDWALFRPRTYLGFDAEGRLYVTDDQGYRVDVRDRHGLVRSVRRSYSPRRLGEPDVAALKEAAIHVVDTMSRMPEQSRPRERTQIAERIDRQASLPLPEVMTPLGGLLVSPDGSFWVQVSDSTDLVEREADLMFGMFGGLPQTETSWDLYDPDGLYLGSVTLPARFRAEAVVGLDVVGVWADELDVEYVVKYRAGPAG